MLFGIYDINGKNDSLIKDMKNMETEAPLQHENQEN